MIRNTFVTKFKRLEKRTCFSSFEVWKGINRDGIPILSKVLGGLVGAFLGPVVGGLFGTTGLILGSVVIALLSSALIEQFLPKILSPRISRLSENPTDKLKERLHQRLDEARKNMNLEFSRRSTTGEIQPEKT